MKKILARWSNARRWRNNEKAFACCVAVTVSRSKRWRQRRRVRLVPRDAAGLQHPLTTYVAPTPINTPLRLPSRIHFAGNGLVDQHADTAGLVFSHFFTDHIAATVVAGVPPDFEINGHGTIQPPGPAGAAWSIRIWRSQTNPIVKSVRAMESGADFQYYFNAPTASSARSPALACRITFSRTSNSATTSNVDPGQSRRDAGGGRGQAGADQASAKASSSWQPVFNLRARPITSTNIGACWRR